MRPARIIIFAKEPVPGRVKTRLIPALGAQGAANLAAEMLATTIAEASAAGVGEPELCGDPHPLGWYEGPTVYRTEQGQGDLGIGQRKLGLCIREGPLGVQQLE